MNNIFYTYNQNNYNNMIKNNIKFDGYLDKNTLNAIVHKYFIKMDCFNVNGLNKFVTTVVNVFFNRINYNMDITPVLLLGLNNISTTHLQFTALKVVELVKKDVSPDILIVSSNLVNPTTEIIISKIVSKLSYSNRDRFSLYFKQTITSLLNNKSEILKKPVKTEAFITNLPMLINNQYYLSSDDSNLTGILLELDNIEKHHISYDLDIKLENLDTTLLYSKNISIVNSIISYCLQQVKLGNNVNYLTLVYLIFNKFNTASPVDIKKDLLSEQIDFKSLLKYIYNAKDGNQIQNLTIEKIINKSSFRNRIQKITLETDLNNKELFDENQLFTFIFNFLRNSSANDLKQIMNVSALLSDLYTNSKDKYLTFISKINKTNITFNLNEYDNITEDNKTILINSMNGYEINYLIKLSSRDSIMNNINMNVFKSFVINYYQ